MIKVTCPECKKKYSIIDAMEGKQIRCHSCDCLFNAPKKNVIKWVSTICIHCKKLYRVSQELLGTNFKCRRCECDFTVTNFDKQAQLKSFCPGCGKRYRIVNKELLGKVISCKVCDIEFEIKEQEEEKEPIRTRKPKVVSRHTRRNTQEEEPVIFAQKTIPKKKAFNPAAETIAELPNAIKAKGVIKTRKASIKNKPKPVDLDQPVKTVRTKKVLTREDLEFATAETINPQDESMQSEIAKQIRLMEQPAKTQEKLTPMTREELEFATAETIDPQNQSIQSEIAKQIRLMEMDSDAYSDSSEMHIDLRATAEEIYIDDVVDDYDVDDPSDDSSEDIYLDLRATAEEIIIDDELEDDYTEEDDDISQTEEDEEDEDDGDMPIDEIEDSELDISVDLSVEDTTTETKGKEQESSVDMAAVFASSQDDSGFLRLDSQDVLIASEILMPVEDVLTPSEAGIPSLNNLAMEKNFQFSSTSQFLNENLEKTASMLVIDAEGLEGDEWSSEKQTDWNIGDVIIGIYSVTEELGIEEFGKVYKVYHKQLSINMTVKTISFENCDKENLEKELGLWENLGIHPHLLSYYYLRNLKGVPRIFMEYLEGNDLSSVIKKEHNESDSLYRQDEYSTAKRILDIAIQMAWGLEYAHDQNMIHGDIRPQNVLVMSNNTIKITNFVLGKVYPSHIKTYSSPSKYKNNKMMDIWSWALTVLEMFSGASYWQSGVNAKKAIEAYDKQNRRQNIPVLPNQLKEVLLNCVQDQYASFKDILPILHEIYFKATEIEYPRQEPDIELNIADGLSNRAVFLMDLESFTEAESILKKALKIDNHHVHATYNLSLLQWRSGTETDDLCIQKLNSLLSIEQDKWQTYHFLSWINIERGDKHSTYQALNSAEKYSDGNIVIQNIISQTMDNVSDSYDLQHTLKGHEESIGSVCICDDANIVVSASSDGSIRIWNTILGECSKVLLGHSGYVNGVSLTSNGKTLASASWDKSIRIWNIESGECTNIIRGHEHYVNDVVFSDNGEIIISASWDKTIRIWDVSTSVCKKVLKGHDKNINAIDFSSEVGIIVSGSSDNTVRIWDVNSGECLRVLEGHEDQVWDVAITSDGDLAVSVSWDQTIRIWDIWTGRCLRILKGHTDKISGVSLSKDATKIFTSSWDNTIRIWDAASGRCLRTLNQHNDKVYDVCMSNSLNIVVSASADQTLQVWKLAKQTKMAPLMLVRSKENNDNRVNQNLVTILLAEIRKAINNEKWEAAANLLNTARQKRGYERYPECLELWEKLSLHTARGILKGAWQRNALEDHKHYIEALAIEDYGQYCFAASYNNIYKWNLQKGECAAIFNGHSCKIKGLAISTQANIVVSCGDDKTIRVWDLENGTCKFVSEKQEYALRSIAVMPNGYIGIAASYKDLSVWNLESGNHLFNLLGHEHWVESIAITPDGRMAISGSYDKTIRIWDIASAKCIKVLRGHDDGVRSVAISVDGRMAVSGSYDNTIRIWDVATGKCLNVLRGHRDRVESVAMSLDGQIVISASWDKTLRMWDITTGKNLCTLEGHMDKLRCTAISPNANLAMTGGWGKSLRIWNIDWELIPKSKNKWDENVKVWLNSFLSVRTPMESEDPKNPLFLMRKGKPCWTEDDFKYFSLQLQNSGFGWMDTQKVEDKLKKMAENWDCPPPLPGNK